MVFYFIFVTTNEYVTVLYSHTIITPYSAHRSEK